MAEFQPATGNVICPAAIIAKQLAQHSIMEITNLPVLANGIEVLAQSLRPAGESQ